MTYTTDLAPASMTYKWSVTPAIEERKNDDHEKGRLYHPGKIKEIRNVEIIKTYVVETDLINFRIKVIYNSENKLKEICIEQGPKKIYITPEHVKALLKVLVHEEMIDDLLKEISKDVMS